ncbi:hypothetical protein G3I19_00945 [Streptomyces sp. SID10853]|uniref:hypothetical protein n=1 Tax=Streptomyces sp. SID10853 TaxID=2706028 RepID=UPI0013C12EE5|nr:hypothetical protein [Streptomyces sp. SID10853]NDZ77110.1 hypothetical protein [Streptomyces sp. SID10853]
MSSTSFDERTRQPAAPRPRPVSRGVEHLAGVPDRRGIGPMMGSLQALAGNRAASMVVQRLATGGEVTGAEVTGAEATDSAAKVSGDGTGKPAAKASRSGLNIRERIAAALERANKHLDVLDTLVSRGLSPAGAEMGWKASQTSDTRLAEQVHTSSTVAGAENAVTDGVTAVNNVIDARKAYKESKENPTGPASHAPHKKFSSKTLDAIQNLASYGSDVIGLAKNSLPAEAIVTAASLGEAGGGVVGAVAGVKTVRGARRVGLTTRKYRAVKKIDVPAPVDDPEIARLREAEVESHWALAQAYVELERAHDGDEDGLSDRLGAALDRASGAFSTIEKAAGDVQRAKDINVLNTTRDYALAKQRNKLWKQGVGAVGDSVRTAGGAVTIAAAATGALASNPVGWGLAATAAGLLLSVTAYKAGRAGQKRYEGARHPDRWAPPKEEGDPATAEPASRPDALKEALKFWKKVEHSKRDAMARTLFGLAAGPEVPAGQRTSPELRASARELLVALKAGPANLHMTVEDWEKSLNDPADAEKWQKEIANQLASS